MSQWKDPLETPKSSSDEFLRLQKEIAHLQQENKVLHIRAQGVQVLGKVLQDSQENNAKLKHEVEQLKSHLVQKGIDAAQADLSVCTVDDDVLQSEVVEQSGSHHSSLAKSSIGIHDYVNVTTVSGPHSFSAGFPSLLTGDFRIKGINVEFQQITCELDLLIKEVQSLQENVERLPENERDKEIQDKLTRLFPKLNEYAKQSRTRETLSSALVSEEEQIKTKLAAMEEEQASHENVVQELKEKLDSSKEEIAHIQSEIKFFQEAVLVKREHESALTNRQPSSMRSEQSPAAASTSDKSIIVKTPLLQTGPETCEGCVQLQRQTTELQRQLLATKAEKDEALKLKEEILDVNHKWDAQYKMLVAAANKEISDLKHQVQVFKSSSDRRTGQFPEPTMMERSWLQYQQPRTPQSSSMEQQPSHSSILGAAALPTGAPAAAPAQGPTSWPGTTPYSQQISSEVPIYEEVFKREKREKASLQQQLKANYTSSGSYSCAQSQYNPYGRGLDYTNQEWQRQNYPLVPRSYSCAQSQYNPYGRGLDYTNQEWQRQNYPLVPRGLFPPRGPVAHPASQSSNANSMYHGGEVLHDRLENVVDSPADGNDTGEAGVSDKEVIQLEACPHCLRKCRSIRNFETPEL